MSIAFFIQLFNNKNMDNHFLFLFSPQNTLTKVTSIISQITTITQYRDLSIQEQKYVPYIDIIHQ